MAFTLRFSLFVTLCVSSAQGHSGSSIAEAYLDTKYSADVVAKFAMERLDSNEKLPPFLEAYRYSTKKAENVAIMIFFGPGHNVTSSQVCEAATKRLFAQAAKEPVDVLPKCFVEVMEDREYLLHMGFFMAAGLSVEAKHYAQAKLPENLSKVTGAVWAAKRLLGSVK